MCTYVSSIDKCTLVVAGWQVQHFIVEKLFYFENCKLKFKIKIIIIHIYIYWKIFIFLHIIVFPCIFFNILENFNMSETNIIRAKATKLHYATLFSSFQVWLPVELPPHQKTNLLLTKRGLNWLQTQLWRKNRLWVP